MLTRPRKNVCTVPLLRCYYVPHSTYALDLGFMPIDDSISFLTFAKFVRLVIQSVTSWVTTSFPKDDIGHNAQQYIPSLNKNMAGLLVGLSLDLLFGAPLADEFLGADLTPLHSTFETCMSIVGLSMEKVRRGPGFILCACI